MDAARILLGEDSEAIRVPVRTALRAPGFAVEAVPDGADLEAGWPPSPPISSCWT